MFFGLNKYIKNWLPKKLFYRSLFIIITPVILLQVIISIVFFDSLWIKSNKELTASIVDEVRLISNVYKDNNEKEIERISGLYKNNLDFIISFNENTILNTKKKERWFSPVDRSLRRGLKLYFGNSFWFDTTSYKNLIEIQIANDRGVLQVLFPKNKISPSSVRIFALWITIPAIILIIISIIFIKNQTRPITNLAKNAEKFGRGEFIDEFRPSGALEIRQAAYEFDRMRKRITRHLNQRSEMLSGISHDLRTPLTRLKLQLAMLQQKDLASKMESDINEMEKMLNEYLEFASKQKTEKTEIIDTKKFVQNILLDYKKNKIKVKLLEKVKVNGRHNALKRCFVNLINNALSYGNEVEIQTAKTVSNVMFLIDDDGPGIDEKEISNVFKPFYRIDKSRNQNKSGVGLGLSIANDIIKSHGGQIALEKSPKNGLRVKILLPN
tara:strand:- start:4507 stop:5826 length:1320 start_codon:yes stop_codon:yes gene_type:complete